MVSLLAAVRDGISRQVKQGVRGGYPQIFQNVSYKSRGPMWGKAQTKNMGMSYITSVNETQRLSYAMSVLG